MEFLGVRRLVTLIGLIVGDIREEIDLQDEAIDQVVCLKVPLDRLENLLVQTCQSIVTLHFASCLHLNFEGKRFPLLLLAELEAPLRHLVSCMLVQSFFYHFQEVSITLCFFVCCSARL